MKCSGHVLKGPRSGGPSVGDVSASGGTLEFDLPKINSPD